MRDHSAHIELTREEALNALLTRTPFAQNDWKRPFETVAITDSYGRILADDVRAMLPSPTCLTAQMDSVALHWDDIKDIPEGTMPDTSSWVRGIDWQFSNTGVAMPTGFDTALAIESVEVAPDEQSIKLTALPKSQGQGTRPTGSNHQTGDILAHAGQTVSPLLASRMAGGNHSAVAVACKPRVAFIATGGELIPPGCPPLPVDSGKLAAYGKTVESNTVLVKGLVEHWGGKYLPMNVRADDYDAIKEAVLMATQMADIVVLNGGSSKGSDDWCVEVLDEIGDIICHQISHAPAHHSSLAMVGEVPVVGVSGPPTGAELVLRLYVHPLINAFLGLDPKSHAVSARLMEDFPQHGGPRHAGGGFSLIKSVKLVSGADGGIEAYPMQGAISEDGEESQAYVVIPKDPAERDFNVGGVIEVELRD